MSEARTDRRNDVRSPRFPSSKFCPPREISELVHRSRLLDELDGGQRARLTLVVASPGAGKTALLTDWLAAHPERLSSWVACEAADADPVRFFAALIEATRRATDTHDIGEDALQLLTLDGQVSADAVAALADDLEQVDTLRAVVIDDFHLTGLAGSHALGLLMDYRPPGVQLVVASRVDPQLRLQRMRLNNELVELRDLDLSFSPKETRLFLEGLGVQPSEQELAVIHDRSEGWATGLQMAAIAIQQSPDSFGRATRFESKRHSASGYFLEEVLAAQPADVVDFMLATSILEELSVPACTALCGQHAAAHLQHLRDAHLFVTQVDDQASTYRYHPLIRDVLQSELRQRDPGRERRLHEAAGRYLADAGQLSLATAQLLAGGDPAAAFALLSQRLLSDFVSNPALGSALDLAEIQPELYAGTPAILVPLATELYLRGAFDRGRRALDLAEQTGVDPDEQPDLAMQLGTVKANYLANTGQLTESLAVQDRATRLARQTGGADLWLVLLNGTGMQCHLYLGDYDKAEEMADAVMAAHVSRPVSEVLCPGVKSQVAITRGGLAQAKALAATALDSAAKVDFEEHYFAFPALRTSALLALEQRDFDTAATLTERVLQIVSGGRPAFEYLAQLDRARIWAAQQHIDEALSSLPEARATLKSKQSVLFAHADELEARLRLALGDRHGARVATKRLPDDRRQVLSAIIAVAEDDWASASKVLNDVTQQGTTIRTDLELRLLQAEIATLQSSPLAPQLVRSSLDLIVRHGFVQTVFDTAPGLVDHLVSESERLRENENLRALLAAAIDVRKSSRTGPSRGQLPDPLTEAETRVLENLAQRLTYADIAAELHLSLNTVKTHLRHSYMKLGVSSRTTAIKRATSLGVI